LCSLTDARDGSKDDFKEELILEHLGFETLKADKSYPTTKLAKHPTRRPTTATYDAK
jgi:hypothetical protein